MYCRSICIFVLLSLFVVEGCLAAQFESIKIYPENVGVFTNVRKQQFVAFGVYPNGSSENITTSVDWKSSNSGIVTIDNKGVARIVVGRTFGQVTINCSYPKEIVEIQPVIAAIGLLLLSPPEEEEEKILALNAIYLLLLKEKKR